MIKHEREETSKKDTTLYNLALKEQNTETCKEIQAQSEQVRCLDMVQSTIALKGQDIEQCAAVSQTEIRERCRDNVLIVQSETATEK
jgi:hypothetical protein